MTTRSSLLNLSIALISCAFFGCGGAGGSSGGGGSELSISAVTPSAIMVGLPIGQVTLLGQGFTNHSLVLLDGQSVPSIFLDSGTLEAQINVSLNAAPGTHQFSVQDGKKVSNSVPYTVYAPKQGSFVMQAISGFPVGQFESDPTFIAAADIDGDGLSDVIMPGPDLPNSGSIAVLRGQADGTLSPAQYIPTTTPWALAAGDVDGNGTVDLVSITSDNSSSTTVSILLGDGHGNFQQPVAQQTLPGIFPGPAFLVDLDGDGRRDLLLAVEKVSGIGNSLVWLKNTGGGFGAPTTLTTITLDNDNLQIADFNRDGKPDILYAVPGTSTSPESLHIFWNEGEGNFKDQAVAGLNGIIGTANVIDFNLDGIPDLVVQVPQGNLPLYSFGGNGDGSFTEVANTTIAPQGGFHVYQLVVGDFDHDGFPDLAGVNGETQPSHILYLFGDGQGNFLPQQAVGPQGGFVAVADINGDGLPDVLVPDRFSFVSASLGRKDRNYASLLPLSPATVIGGLSASDINGDGLPEIFVGGDPVFGVDGTVFLNQGNNSFQFAANTDPITFLIGDLTGKGVADLLGGTPGNSLEIWPNNGSLDFSSSPITLPPPITGPFAIADMDGDGHRDIVALGQIFYGNGSYQFTSVSTPDPFLDPYVVGDFNGDGKLDIAAGGTTFLNAGGRTFREVHQNLPLLQGALAVVADFNGDGKDDVAIAQPNDAMVSVWYSNGDGTFAEATALDPGQLVGGLAVGDFDGDGRPDLAVGLFPSQQVCLLFNSGQGRFARSFFGSGADTIDMIAVDLNHDGKPDLVIANFLLDFRPPNVNVAFHK